MNLHRYIISIGIGKSHKVRAWDALDAGIKYLKYIHLWSEYSDKTNQRNLDALKIKQEG